MHQLNQKIAHKLRQLPNFIIAFVCGAIILSSVTTHAHAKSGYRICKSWENIKNDVRHNIDLIENNLQRIKSDHNILIGQYPVAMYLTNLPDSIKIAAERNFELFYGVGNFDYRQGGQKDSQSAILILFSDEPSPQAVPLAQTIYSFISESLFSSESEDSEEKRKNYAINLASAFISSLPSDGTAPYEFRNYIDKDEDNSNFMIYFIRKNHEGKVSNESLHNMAKAFSIFAGIPPIQQFKHSIFSPDNSDSAPTDVDIAVATAISGPAGLAGSNERFDAINAKCTEP